MQKLSETFKQLPKIDWDRDNFVHSFQLFLQGKAFMPMRGKVVISPGREALSLLLHPSALGLPGVFLK